MLGFVFAVLICNLAFCALVREHPSFPLGGKYPEGGIEGTAPKVKDQTEKTHPGTLFSQKRFRSAFFDSFPQGEAFAACGRDGGASTKHFDKLQFIELSMTSPYVSFGPSEASGEILRYAETEKKTQNRSLHFPQPCHLDQGEAAWRDPEGRRNGEGNGIQKIVLLISVLPVL